MYTIFYPANMDQCDRLRLYLPMSLEEDQSTLEDNDDNFLPELIKYWHSKTKKKNQRFVSPLKKIIKY